MTGQPTPPIQGSTHAGKRWQTVPRAQLLRLVQRHLTPYLEIREVEELLTAAEQAGCVEADSASAELRYEPVQTLHNLVVGHPFFGEDREGRVLVAEEEVFRGGPLPRRRAYHLAQTVRIRPCELGSYGTARLWIPVPRHIPGVQTVTLIGTEPKSLADRLLEEAGQVYDVPILVSGFQAPPPPLRLEFEVEQNPREMARHVEPDLALCEAGSADDPALTQWLDAASVETGASPARQVEQVLDAMERCFQSTVYGPMTLAALLAIEVGNTHTLTRFLAAALDRLQIATMVSAAQLLPFETERHTLKLTMPGTLGYEHRFLHWCDPATQVCGSVDLLYFGRWAAILTEDNTRDLAIRARLEELGKDGRNWLRSALYPGEMVISGAVPPSRFVSLLSGETTYLGGAVDTELCIRRIA